jgi:predicted phosphodiesterase
MKLFFISDIHGSIEDLNIALDIFAEEKADYLILLGDILYHGPRNPLPINYNPQEVVKSLNPHKEKNTLLLKF